MLASCAWCDVRSSRDCLDALYRRYWWIRRLGAASQRPESVNRINNYINIVTNAVVQLLESLIVFDSCIHLSVFDIILMQLFISLTGELARKVFDENYKYGNEGKP